MADSVATCWSCKGPVPEEALFCPTCGAIAQKLPQDYFTLMGLEPTFQVDAEALETAYFNLSRQLHPDKFAGGSSKALMLAMQHGATVNEAYQTLKDDLARADYLLKQNGIEAFAEQGQGDTPPELMQKSFMLHEELEEANTPEQLQTLADQLDVDMAACLKTLDESVQTKAWQDVKTQALTLKFLQTFSVELRRKQKELNLKKHA